ncbi:MAG: bifunctional adenosylcobinamide kinase/adenosylcobinamide-phosphate guanylyltransferase [Pseudomonadota bacterium]
MAFHDDYPHVLLLGGARSGKSGYAEHLSVASGLERVYIATAEAGDGEMSERIRLHRDRRGDGWQTIEDPLVLADIIAAEASPSRVLLVDCLTLWLSNHMFAKSDIARETARLRDALKGARSPVLLVSNEVGLGIVPDNALARRFRDAAGRLHQALAGDMDCVLFFVAGLPMVVKPAPKIAGLELPQ